MSFYVKNVTSQCTLKESIDLFSQLYSILPLMQFKIVKNEDFNQHFECAAPKRLVKYTTDSSRITDRRSIKTMLEFMC